jgi:chromosome segregation ATPase
MIVSLQREINQLEKQFSQYVEKDRSTLGHLA